MVTCGRTPEPSPSLWLSVEQAYRESEAGALSHVLVDGRGPLWPGPNDLIHRPFRHLAGGENQVTLSHLGSAQVQERRGWGLGWGLEWGTSSLDLTYGLVLRGFCIWLFRLQLPARRCKGKG